MAFELGTTTGEVQLRDPPPSGPVVATIPAGTEVTTAELKNGYYLVFEPEYGWAPASSIAISGSAIEAVVSQTNAKETGSTGDNGSATSADSKSNTMPDWTEALSAVGLTDNDSGTDDDYWQDLSEHYMFSLGYPPKYNMDVDPQYEDQEMTDENPPSDKLFHRGHGRAFAKTYFANPPILSICPGRVKMFPELFGVERDSFIQTLFDLAAGNDSLQKKILTDQGSKFSGKLYKFESDLTTYAYYVNALCRCCAVLMGVGDKTVPYTGTKLKEFDFNYWMIRRQYKTNTTVDVEDKSIFREFSNQISKSAKKVSHALTDETAYINFFINGTEPSVNEDISTDVSESPLESIFGGINDIAQKINYFTGSGFNAGTDDVETALKSVLSGSNSGMGIFELGSNFLKGGKLVLPKMVGNSHYSKSINVNMRFSSPYGNRYSIFMRCIVPICHLWALALPRQLSDNMYSYPFLIRANQVGCFHCDLGVITGLSIQRGGSDETAWTVDGLPTEYDVSFQIQPLVDDLMITGSNHPGLFCKNENLLDYLGTYCGFDLLANNMDTRLEMVAAFYRNALSDELSLRNMDRRILDRTHNTLQKYGDLAWGVQ